MRVRSNVPHFSTDGALHERGDVYDLDGDELAFRLKDAIVADETVSETPRAMPAPDPAE